MMHDQALGAMQRRKNLTRCKADLLVHMVHGQARTSGEGQGEISEARIAGIPAGAIRLRLHADGLGFRFSARGDAKTTPVEPAKDQRRAGE